MKYRKLGKTNLSVSVVGLGTAQYGGEYGKSFTVKEVKAILDYAGEKGINLIDTAECYGEHTSEKLIGEAVGQNRDKWIISTKFGHICHIDSVFRKKQDEFSVTGVKKQLEDSLSALCTDYIDIYLFHSGTNEHLENDDLWTMLDKEKQAGKIKHLGLSPHPVTYNNIHQVSLAERYGAEVIEILYNRLDRSPEDGVFYICREKNLGVLARVPLAQGFLSGRYKPGATFPANDLRHNYYEQNIQDERLSRALLLLKYEVPEGMNMADWAMEWCLRHPAVSACIPGFNNLEQLEGGLRAAEMACGDHPLALK